MRQRPVVAYQSARSPEELAAAFRDALARPGCPCAGRVGARELSLHVQEGHRHTWSPWLSLELRQEGEGTLLQGRFGPQPGIWTIFVFLYGTLVVVGLMAAVYGAVVWSLEGDPTGLLAALADTGALGLACAVDLTGRRVGEAQMGVIRGFVQAVVPDAVDRGR